MFIPKTKQIFNLRYSCKGFSQVKFTPRSNISSSNANLPGHDTNFNTKKFAFICIFGLMPKKSISFSCDSTIALFCYFDLMLNIFGNKQAMFMLCNANNLPWCFIDYFFCLFIDLYVLNELVIVY